MTKEVRFKGLDLQCPDWTRYLAIDDDGEIYAFQEEPIMDNGVYVPSDWDMEC